MQSLADTLRNVEQTLGAAVGRAYRSRELRGLDDEQVLSLVQAASAIARQAEALVIGAVAELEERMDVKPHAERPTARYGCRSMKELVQRTTLASGRTAGDVVRAARALQQAVAVSTGEVLEADYPALREAAADGVVGLEALVAIVAALTAAQCERGAPAAAEAELAASARGDGVDGGPGASADDLRLQAQVWATYLDQDGAEPRELRALRKRTLTIGVCRDGIGPLRGNLLPEVASQMQRLFDSILNPKGDGPDTPTGPHFSEVADPSGDDPSAETAEHRSRAMQQHDALAMVLAVAARSGEVPTIGGAAPTLVVAVASDDLASGRGQAHIDGCDEPVSLAVARQVACSGAVYRVSTDVLGRILAIDVVEPRVLGSSAPGDQPARRRMRHPRVPCARRVVRDPPRDRAFPRRSHRHRQWRSAVLVPPSHARFQRLKSRMMNGVPEVRGPSWWDVQMRWRPVTTSPTRLSRSLRARSPG